MKKILGVLFFGCTTIASFSQQEKKQDTLLLQPIEIKAIRANDKAPFTKTDLTRKEIDKLNVGQDLPFVLNQLPSVVVNSDAGNGVGYTGIHIRGTDATRINVTLNGIPYNDAESQGTYFVDLPDISSSVNSIQVQRGVGTSSNGAGAFGASINLFTNEISDSFHAEMNNSFGSFNTWKNTFKVSSGLMGKHFTLDARISKISSDGYIERAATNLKSAYISTAYIDANNSLRFNFITGREKTYQAWYGVPESYLDTNRTYNPAGTEKPGNPYDNETDNYTQTHYQLFYNRKINSQLGFNTALFYTKGEGYYEEYRSAQNFSDYGLPDVMQGSALITQTDLIRDLWLDNNFYGGIFSFQQKGENAEITVGGGWNKYDGKHYGIVKWAQIGFPADYKYYNLDAHKTDVTFYTKVQQQLSQHWQGFADIQLRGVQYNINGFDHNPSLIIHNNYFFVNPKIGVSYFKNNLKAYLSYSLGSKEPNRDDFEASIDQQPSPEYLHDVELGIEHKTQKYFYGATFYYMYYYNQLVLTGKINDVGSYTRTNTPNSYRAGIELQAGAKINDWVNASANLTLSKNKIKKFTEYVDDYDNGGQKSFEYRNTDISFSPNVISAATINILPAKNIELSFISKYVGKQYLDNTQKNSRSLKEFYMQDVRLTYTIFKKLFKETDLSFQLYNVFNKKYEPNGYTYSYYYGGSLATENYYFPMAGVNFFASVNIKL